MISSLFLESVGSGPRLRIGVIVDGPHLTRQYSAVLRDIRACNFAELCLVIRTAPGAPTVTAPPASRMMPPLASFADPQARAAMLYKAYGVWDRWRNPSAAAALAKTDASDLLAGIPELVVDPVVKGSVHGLLADDVDKIRSHRLDVIFQFGCNVLQGELLSTARFGVWSYLQGDLDYYRGGSAYYWELVEQAALSGAVLQVLTGHRDGGRIIAKTLAPTVGGMSRLRNALGPHVAAQPLAIWKLKELHEKGEGHVLPAAQLPRAYLGQRNTYGAPSNLEIARFIIRTGTYNLIRRLSRDKRSRQWRIALRRVSTGAPWSDDWSNFRWVEAPAGHFYADPFLLEREGRTWVFVEDYVDALGRGIISCAEVAPAGDISPFEPVLTAAGHLSFPFVFEQQGEVYMIPETSSSGRIELWRAEQFPRLWTLDRVLLEKPGLDTVLHIGEDGRHYWLTSFRQGPGGHPNLFLFHSDGLREPWRLHPSSPLSLDARYSRNAGRLFWWQGALHRPSQDLTPWYGSKMHFHRIERFDREAYIETLVGDHKPQWGPDAIGTHTFERSTQWEIIDGLWLVDRGAMVGSW